LLQQMLPNEISYYVYPHQGSIESLSFFVPLWATNDLR
jgi:hypothetical protein